MLPQNRQNAISAGSFFSHTANSDSRSGVCLSSHANAKRQHDASKTAPRGLHTVGTQRRISLTSGVCLSSHANAKRQHDASKTAPRGVQIVSPLVKNLLFLNGIVAHPIGKLFTRITSHSTTRT